mmetsp:Transcript_18505/g.35224  ORF Transcript_18505/g.35224 Transcript_18505/m.35224 type:complete len:344 (+) Transcript_18505:3302-4333(+)
MQAAGPRRGAHAQAGVPGALPPTPLRRAPTPRARRLRPGVPHQAAWPGGARAGDGGGEARGPAPEHPRPVRRVRLVWRAQHTGEPARRARDVSDVRLRRGPRVLLHRAAGLQVLAQGVARAAPRQPATQPPLVLQHLSAGDGRVPGDDRAGHRALRPQMRQPAAAAGTGNPLGGVLESQIEHPPLHVRGGGLRGVQALHVARPRLHRAQPRYRVHQVPRDAHRLQRRRQVSIKLRPAQEPGRGPALGRVVGRVPALRAAGVRVSLLRPGLDPLLRTGHPAGPGAAAARPPRHSQGLPRRARVCGVRPGTGPAATPHHVGRAPEVHANPPIGCGGSARRTSTLR